MDERELSDARLRELENKEWKTSGPEKIGGLLFIAAFVAFALFVSWLCKQ